MTALTDRQKAWLTSELGSTVTPEAMQARYDAVGTVRSVATSLLQERVNALVQGGALSVSISGVASVNQSENVKALERQIARIQRLDDDPSDDTGQPLPDGMQPVEFRRIGSTRRRR